jgi:hypothetical protein
MLLDVPSTPKTDRFSAQTIGQRIKDARRHRVKPPLSTEKLAERAKIGVDSLYKKQRGEQPWYMDEVSRVCEVLDAPYGFPFIEWGEARMLEDLLHNRPPLHEK